MGTSRRFLRLLATHSLQVVAGRVFPAHTVWLCIHESLSFCIAHTAQGLPLVIVRGLVLEGYMLANPIFYQKAGKRL